MKPYVVQELLQFFNRSVKSCIPIAHHITPYWELTVVLNGQLTYVIDGTEYKICSNDAILVSEGAHRFRYEGSAADYISFNFVAEKDSLTLLRNVLYKNILSHELRTVISLFPRKSLYWGASLMSADYERGKAFNLLNYLLLDMLHKVSSKNKSDNIKKAISFIRSRLFSTAFA